MDRDPRVLNAAKSVYPCLKSSLIHGEFFKNKSFDTVVFRESLHHVDRENLFSEIIRICKMEIIVIESNPNWLLRACRKIISHKEPEINLNSLKAELEEYGVTIVGLFFRDVIAFPLSECFVGPEFLPLSNSFSLF